MRGTIYMVRVSNRRVTFGSVPWPVSILLMVYTAQTEGEHSVAWILASTQNAGLSLTAPAVVSRLHEAVGRALAAPSVTRLFANQGAEVVGNSPDEFAAAFDAEVQRWRKVASDGGLKFD